MRLGSCFATHGPGGLLTSKALGAPSLLGDHQRQTKRQMQMTNRSRLPMVLCAGCWLIRRRGLFEEFRISDHLRADAPPAAANLWGFGRSLTKQVAHKECDDYLFNP